jgi:ethanolamine ammonia-lyase small subunit
LLERLLPALSETWRVAPIVIAGLARVGLGDAICSALGAASVLVLIGERPGLSATDSLSAYVTGRPSAELRTPTGIAFRIYDLRASPMTRPRDRSPIC